MTKNFTQLANGMKVLSEHVPAVETVSLGVWLPCGSRHEHPHENGMFHFIEHLLFKGTPSRNARQIAEDVDGVGALLDAYTTREETCYTFKVREKHVPFMLHILAEMIREPLFNRVELEREKQVVLEEIKMGEDNPEDLVYDKSLFHLWQGHALANPVLGTTETVSNFNQDSAKAFHRKRYRARDLIVAAAGKIDHDWLCAELEKLFPADSVQTPADLPGEDQPTSATYQVYQCREHLEQVSFCLNFKAISYRHPDLDALHILNTLLGGSMSSRLFQRIREERGLAYSVGSFTSLFRNCGVFSIYGGCSPESFDEVITLSLQILREIKDEGICTDELERAREQLIGTTLMGLESTGSRSSALAQEMIQTNEVFDLKKTIDKIESISQSQVTDLARQIFQDESMGLMALGRLPAEAPATPWHLH